MHSTRTLSYVGEKATLSAVRSKNKITHRYTLQPAINLAGQIVGPVFVCLQEKDGRMGERVRKNLFHANNVVTSCSSSGKLNTSLVQYWINNCLFPSLSHSRTLLLSDSWNEQSEKHGFYDEIRDGMDTDVTERNNILKLQSLTHNQLSAPVFTAMIKYAWFKAGYLDVHPGPFKTVIEVCYGFDDLQCHVRNCSSCSFIRCSYCGSILCIEHFFNNYHFH
ncbi:unnamed protein product [Rotaria sordida]|uniref:Transposase Tc5 C-terminal domain-containing protein n=2 Tax=Rotaria sordida TaxID=392033 RepID=A0A815K606_9BILA|nr:unnamed protein product [Rotaria sordida]